MQCSYHHSVRCLADGVNVKRGPGRSTTTDEVTAGITRVGERKERPERSRV